MDLLQIHRYSAPPITIIILKVNLWGSLATALSLPVAYSEPRFAPKQSHSQLSDICHIKIIYDALSHPHGWAYHTLQDRQLHSHNIVFHTGVRTHMGTQKECNKEIGGRGGGGGASKKTEFEVTWCSIVCRSGEFLMQFWRYRRTEYDRYQKGTNTIALQHSRKNSIGQGGGGGGGGGYEEYNIICVKLFLRFYVYFLLLILPPEGRPGMSDVPLLSGISGLSFDAPFLSPLVFSA